MDSTELIRHLYENPESWPIRMAVIEDLVRHGEVDRAREIARGDEKIGTTGRGIGPAYEDKVGRRAIRLCDLADRDLLERRVDQLLKHHNPLMRGLGQKEFDAGEAMKVLRNHEDARCWMSIMAPIPS